VRKKADILDGITKLFKEVDDSDFRAERVIFHLTEVLIDIRDILNFQLKEIDRSIQGIKPKP